MDHLGKIKKWLKDVGLPNRYPSEKDVKELRYFTNMKISEDEFRKSKEKLIEYLSNNKKVEVIVRDHCHWTGKFRGAAHQRCNLMYRKTYKIPVFFHNFSGYDSHHIFNNMSNLDKPPTVIASSLENFISMEIEGLVIKDSLKFLNCSLDTLASNLKEKGLNEKSY